MDAREVLIAQKEETIKNLQDRLERRQQEHDEAERRLREQIEGLERESRDREEALETRYEATALEIKSFLQLVIPTQRAQAEDGGDGRGGVEAEVQGGEGCGAAEGRAGEAAVAGGEALPGAREEELPADGARAERVGRRREGQGRHQAEAAGGSPKGEFGTR